MAPWLDGTDFARYALIPEGLLPAWEGGEAERILGCLRDADANPGAEHSVEALRVELPPSRYRVQSLTVDPDPKTRFRLERLLPA
ncbi:hypothetical protein ABZ318_04100 [Streptomyces sp. NPDC006197]|uniref:hypothetical protein n=1 Tax=Streptomyces sp. NPDC006197 TaxID=3156685 RepID=UPI00339E4D72